MPSEIVLKKALEEFLTHIGLNVHGVTKLVIGSITRPHLFLDFLKLFANMRLAISSTEVQIS